nr:hypothetical protein [Nitrococcus mobilis]
MADQKYVIVRHTEGEDLIEDSLRQLKESGGGSCAFTVKRGLRVPASLAWRSARMGAAMPCSWTVTSDSRSVEATSTAGAQFAARLPVATVSQKLGS